MINIFVMFQFSQSSVPSVSVSPLDHGTYASEKRNVRMYLRELQSYGSMGVIKINVSMVYIKFKKKKY